MRFRGGRRSGSGSGSGSGKSSELVVGMLKIG